MRSRKLNIIACTSAISIMPAITNHTGLENAAASSTTSSLADTGGKNSAALTQPTPITPAKILKILGGPNCALYVDAVRHFPDIEWQASGGVRDAGDLWALANGGVAAAVSGRALLEGRLGAEELKPFLPGA